MKISFIFTGPFILLCLTLHDTEGGLIPRNKNSKIYLTGNTDAYPQDVFHNETAQYWPLHKRGPCGKLMWIEPEAPQSRNGVCKCIETPLGLRQLAHWQPTNRCYFRYDQGPCETEQWLNYNNEAHEWQCQTNPCPNSKLEQDAETDLASLIELETDYYLVSNYDNTTCLRNQLDIKRWNFNFEDGRVSRFLFHKKSGKFYPSGTKGPCSSLMQLVSGTPPAQKFGACTCKFLSTVSRPLVYWKKTDRCYFLFSQGPCFSGEWIVGNFGEVTCRKHGCTETPLMHDEVDYENSETTLLKPEIQFSVQNANGTCYETNTKAYCKDNQKLFMSYDGKSLECYYIDNNGNPYTSLSGGVTSIHDCDEGYQWNENGNCVREPNYN